MYIGSPRSLWGCLWDRKVHLSKRWLAFLRHFIPVYVTSILQCYINCENVNSTESPRWRKINWRESWYPLSILVDAVSISFDNGDSSIISNDSNAIVLLARRVWWRRRCISSRCREGCSLIRIVRFEKNLCSCNEELKGLLQDRYSWSALIHQMFWTAKQLIVGTAKYKCTSATGWLYHFRDHACCAKTIVLCTVVFAANPVRVALLHHFCTLVAHVLCCDGFVGKN